MAAAGASISHAAHSTWFLRHNDGSRWPGLEDIRTQREAAAVVLRACRVSSTAWDDGIACNPGPYHVDGCAIPEYRFEVHCTLWF
jgi:hypothetical protein